MEGIMVEKIIKNNLESIKKTFDEYIGYFDFQYSYTYLIYHKLRYLRDTKKIYKVKLYINNLYKNWFNFVYYGNDLIYDSTSGIIIKDIFNIIKEYCEPNLHRAVLNKINSLCIKKYICNINIDDNFSRELFNHHSKSLVKIDLASKYIHSKIIVDVDSD